MESPAQNHTLDIGVGRLPLKNPEEARVGKDRQAQLLFSADPPQLVVFALDQFA